jgi:hypothetical protein
MIGEMLAQLKDQLSDTYKKLNEAEVEIATLNKQIEKMKCCGNCKHFNWDDAGGTVSCEKDCLMFSKWEIE